MGYIGVGHGSGFFCSYYQDYIVLIFVSASVKWVIDQTNALQQDRAAAYSRRAIMALLSQCRPWDRRMDRHHANRTRGAFSGPHNAHVPIRAPHTAMGQSGHPSRQNR